MTRPLATAALMILILLPSVTTSAQPSQKPMHRASFRE